MPDLTTEYYWHCTTAESWSKEVLGSTGTPYTVRWSNWGHKNQHSHQYDYSCTCASYKYGKGDCKHIKAIKASGEHCKWMQFMDGGKAIQDPNTGEHHCPECNALVSSMGWGV